MEAETLRISATALIVEDYALRNSMAVGVGTPAEWLRG